MSDLDPRPRAVLHDARRRVGRWTLEGLVVLVALSAAAFGVDAAASRGEVMPLVQPWQALAEVGVGLGYVAALTAPFVLLARRRAPSRTSTWLIGAAFLVPLTPVVPAVALVAHLRRRPLRDSWVTVGAYAVLVAWFCWWDLRGPTVQTSAVRAVVAPTGAPPTAEVPLSAGQVLLVVVVLLLTPLLVALYLRSRAELGETRRQVRSAEEATGTLTARLTRQAERELIAREVHDVIGHRLSLLSLHAGGLEVAAGGDTRLAGSAALVRQAAQETMHDLRSLVAVLREPGADGVTATDLAPRSLGDLPRVVDESVTSGAPVVASVYLSHAEEADPVLGGAVYRIVQELLTNARRHAPDSLVRLSVQGGPGDGVSIETVNAAEVRRVGPPGNGLLGVRERAEILGGSLECGPDGHGAFRVRVRLPWVTVAADHRG